MPTLRDVNANVVSRTGLAPAARSAPDGRNYCCYSIDFEDYAHDYQRALGVARPRKTPDALRKAYAMIDRFSTERLGGARLTFFTTGQVARDYPDLVRRVAGDGHEIACHSYEHDQVWHQDRLGFRRDLERAIEYLGAASGQTIKGYRAPDFSIDARSAGWAFDELSRVFLYDSSQVAEHHDGVPGRPSILRFPGSHLSEFALYRHRIAPGVSIRVMGGTYMRLLPTDLILATLREAWQRGFIPQVYLHPYDLLSGYEQWSPYRDLADLPQPRRAYRWARQVQWHTIGNHGLADKLARVYAEFAHPGPMAALVDGGDLWPAASPPAAPRVPPRVE